MDMRRTAPYELGLGLTDPQTPNRTNGDGLQDDGLDDFMDRRSQVSETPAPWHLSSRTPTPAPWHHQSRTTTPVPWYYPNETEVFDKECEMEE